MLMKLMHHQMLRSQSLMTFNVFQVCIQMQNGEMKTANHFSPN